MKIISLEIEGYKNLKAKSIFDFKNCSNYAALIGLNGSGKSNVLEAISLIFSHFYHGTSVNFQFSLKYELEIEDSEKEIMLSNEKMKVEGIKKQVSKIEYQNYLPENIITSYSGEEMRLWEEVYLESYAEFFQDLKNQKKTFPYLLYLNKYAWDIALITLLCSDNYSIKNFIQKDLLIIEDVTIKFDIDEDKYGLFETNEALSLVKRLAGLQKESDGNSVHINEIRTLDLNQKDNLDFTRKIFYYLFITSMPQRSDKVKTQKVINNIGISFNGLDVKKLSEGEKKLILINCITKILADSNSLILLDEPDSHVHIERKKELQKLIERGKQFTVLTTHSPSLLNLLDDKNIFILSNKDESGVTVFPVEIQKHLKEISGGAYSIVNTTLALSSKKDIVLVEGPYDKKYLSKALSILKEDPTNNFETLDFIFINCGGADNVPEFFNTIYLSITEEQHCFILCDDDEPGRKSINTISKKIKKKSLSNCHALCYVKFEGFAENDFLIEDYFPISAYSETYQKKVSDAKWFKHLKAFPDPKNHIMNNYSSFKPETFKNFKALFDKLKSLKEAQETN